MMSSPVKRFGERFFFRKPGEGKNQIMPAMVKIPTAPSELVADDPAAIG